MKTRAYLKYVVSDCSSFSEQMKENCSKMWKKSQKIFLNLLWILNSRGIVFFTSFFQLMISVGYTNQVAKSQLRKQQVTVGLSHHGNIKENY